MATKAQKKAAGRIKAAKDQAETRASGLRAQQADKLRREENRRQNALLAEAENARHRRILLQADVVDTMPAERDAD